jgi:hypothetical protein
MMEADNNITTTNKDYISYELTQQPWGQYRISTRKGIQTLKQVTEENELWK